MAIKNNPQFQWPALHLTQQADELLVLESEADLTAYFGEELQLLLSYDRIIDSLQQQFIWLNNQWQQLEDSVDLQWLQQRVQYHFAAANVCCISKFTLSNVEDVIDLVKSIA
ncbi:hypothetical protein JYB87_15470 [Shewanella avicenniae]|uniref:Uncharacterized protein n=1 Tax=Shewanella avicenniae TaxID=2814294 RepID=A0ABX7QPC0_9GAMM|nr:DUF4144 family protein [Shewanella avicenniae]QSX33109.1 hypothetical protein JYB87_15470 [Shewanella avicenniae]